LNEDEKVGTPVKEALDEVVLDEAPIDVLSDECKNVHFPLLTKVVGVLRR